MAEGLALEAAEFVRRRRAEVFGAGAPRDDAASAVRTKSTPTDPVTVVDTETERQIQEALDNLVQGRTTIAIAHRLSTIRDADVIHVFDGGRLVESGNHEALLGINGLYGRLHALQFAEADKD